MYIEVNIGSSSLALELYSELEPNPSNIWDYMVRCRTVFQIK
jgi:hypothetical protein